MCAMEREEQRKKAERTNGERLNEERKIEERGSREFGCKTIEKDERRIEERNGGEDKKKKRERAVETVHPWATSRAYGVTFAVAFEFASTVHPRRANMPLASTVAHLLE